MIKKSMTLFWILDPALSGNKTCHFSKLNIWQIHNLNDIELERASILMHLSNELQFLTGRSQSTWRIVSIIRVPLTQALKSSHFLSNQFLWIGSQKAFEKNYVRGVNIILLIEYSVRNEFESCFSP